MSMTAMEIKALREKLGRTQKSLATIVGATLMTIGRWERGVATPSPVFEARLRKLAEYAEGGK